MESRGLNPVELTGVAGFEPRSARVGRSLRGAFVYDGGRAKNSHNLWSCAPKTEFFALPPNPRLGLLRRKSQAFQFDLLGGYGGRSERRQGAEGTLA